MSQETHTPCSDMLPYVYKIKKIVRDIKNTPVQGPLAAANKAAITAALADIANEIEQKFG